MNPNHLDKEFADVVCCFAEEVVCASYYLVLWLAIHN